MQLKYVYVFSGLGADERVFKHLKFNGYSPVFIKWDQPAHGETIEQYASGLISQIFTERPILIGLSFGGIVAVEVAKQIAVEKLILIASAKFRKEIPFYYRIAGRLNLHKLLPYRIFNRSNGLTNWFFGTKTEEDRRMLAEILRDTDIGFLKWAIDKIVKWKNQELIPGIDHIHGTSDKILPYRFVKATIQISKGGHFLTVNRAREINEICRTLLS